MGANDLQATKALLEAEAWPGPSLVIAYSTCIAHGIDMSKSMSHQKDAVRSRLLAAVPLPPDRRRRRHAVPPRLQAAVDAGRRLRGVRGALRRARAHATPSGPRELAALLQADVDERWHYYAQLAGRSSRTVPHARHARARCRRCLDSVPVD